MSLIFSDRLEIRRCFSGLGRGQSLGDYIMRFKWRSLLRQVARKVIEAIHLENALYSAGQAKTNMFGAVIAGTAISSWGSAAAARF